MGSNRERWRVEVSLLLRCCHDDAENESDKEKEKSQAKILHLIQITATRPPDRIWPDPAGSRLSLPAKALWKSFRTIARNHLAWLAFRFVRLFGIRLKRHFTESISGVDGLLFGVLFGFYSDVRRIAFIRSATFRHAQSAPHESAPRTVRSASI